MRGTKTLNVILTITIIFLVKYLIKYFIDHHIDIDIAKRMLTFLLVLWRHSGVVISTFVSLHPSEIWVPATKCWG